MEDTVGASAGTGAAPVEGSGTSAAAGGEVAPALTGNAPGGGTDAGGVAAAGVVEPSGAASAEFQILNRRFRDQKHAEEVLGSEIARTRAMQRENAKLQNEFQQAQAELQALRQMVSVRSGAGLGQGSEQGRQGSGGPSAFADELVQSGDLELIKSIAEDPNMGFGHAMYAMAQAFEKRMDSRLEQLRSEAIEPIVLRNAQAQVLARGMSAAKELAVQFPELADDNQSPEAEEAQQEILQTMTSFPREWLAEDPGRALRMAVLDYRHRHGVPVFAQAPGTSGSPSGLAASAAEAAAQRVASEPLDGSGVPRQRPSGQPETFADRVRRENREVARVVKTPSGRPLGFEAT